MFFVSNLARYKALSWGLDVVVFLMSFSCNAVAVFTDSFVTLMYIIMGSALVLKINALTFRYHCYDWRHKSIQDRCIYILTFR